MDILALIPARSGSKGIPHKNIRLFDGKPLLAHSIDHALRSQRITRVIISTDSEEYAEIARSYGAEAPFLRPTSISQDQSTDLEVFQHALQWLRLHEGYEPEVVVQLRPTYPIRDVTDIDNVVDILLQRPEVDAVRSVTPAPETPFKMWFMAEDNRLTPVVNSDLKDAYNMPRQALPATYLQNACIDATRPSVIFEQQSMTGHNIVGYVMEYNYDIDTELQLQAAQAAVAIDSADTHQFIAAAQRLRDKLAQGQDVIICCDIDGIIANLVPNGNYALATPRKEMISVINHLYDCGVRIVLYTARGSATGIDWDTVTRDQMHTWGVCFHELHFGKPAAEYYIDDKLISFEQLSQLATLLN